MEEARKRIAELDERIKTSMSKIKHKLLVLSGKGGVGKSTVTVNLAVALAMRGRAQMVGVLDADITGPSIPKMMGVRHEQLDVSAGAIVPVTAALGIKVVSMDFLLYSDEMAVIWRGPLKSMAIKQFLGEVQWGELEYLLIDLPPGTGDEALTIAQSIPKIDGAVIVTIPSEVSQLVVKKAVTFARHLNIPVVGIVENMSGFVCPKCGAEVDILGSGGGLKIALDLNVPFLGRIPIDPRIREGCDEGAPFVIKYPDSPATKSFTEIVEKIERFMERGEKPS